MGDNPYWRAEDRGFVSPCWVWQRALYRTGYGAIRRGGRNYRAHRWLYEQIVGPIPDGRHLDHLCQVKSCVNPAHLEPVTKRENERRYHATVPRKTHCRQGHDKQGRPTCRECDAASKRAYKVRKRAERQAALAACPPPPKPVREYRSSAEKRAKQSESHRRIPRAPCPECGGYYKAGGGLARHQSVRHRTK